MWVIPALAIAGDRVSAASAMIVISLFICLLPCLFFYFEIVLRDRVVAITPIVSQLDFSVFVELM